MRRLLPLLGLVVLFLAACGGTPTPTATPEPPTAAATTTTTTSGGDPVGQGVLPMPTGLESSLEIPAVGTLVFGQLDPTVAAGTRVPYVIDVVSYYQQGGLTGSTLSIALYADGRVIRNGVQSQVSPEVVEQIVALLEEMRFLDIQGSFEAGSQGADQFRYTVMVETTQGSKTITSEDGFTPDPLLRLYDALKALGQT